MKTSKLLLVAFLAAVGLSQFASAQTAIYISGAPATRKIWNIAIQDLLASQSGGVGNLTESWTGSTTGTSGYATANQTVITGGTYNGTPVTIYTDWSGSTGGNQSLAIINPSSYPTLEIAFLKTPIATPGSGQVLANNEQFQFPNINLSDTQQSTLPFNGTTNVTTPTTSYTQLQEASTTSPAVTGFEFLANKGAPSDLTNITPDEAQYLFQTGATPLALFTGSASDESVNVYPVGRDIASGARYILLAETGIGIANSKSLVQYEPTVTSGTIQPITSSNLPPQATINLITEKKGNGGYSSFSNVLTVLEAASTPSTGYIITYVTDSDAITAVAGGASALEWNGVPYSAQGIELGQYTFWSYLHVYYNAGSATTLQVDFANDLSNQLANDTATGAILSSSVQVTRQLDGGIITPNY
jgi:hypothetical protein